MAVDLYAVLSVSRSSTHAEVKRAYREIARKYHPDKNPGDPEAERIFKEAAEAYRVLGDQELRAQYDKWGRVGAPRAAAPSSGGDPGPAASSSDAAGDVFAEIFGTQPKSRRPQGGGGYAGGGGGFAGGGGGGGAWGQQAQPSQPQQRGRPPTERGEDLRYTLELDFEDAALGCQREISVPRRGTCPSCRGTGARAGTAPIICSACGGGGVVRVQSGFFSTNETCNQCGGSGRFIPDPCPDCRGYGESRSAVTIPVDIPPGVDSGTRLKLTGEGEPGPGGGPRGDLYVQVQVKPHPFFKREEDDVVTEIPISFAQAALGSTIDIPTLEGRVRMRVAPGSQSGRVFRLKGKGIASGHQRGDQRVKVIVEVPTYVSPEQRDLLERYADLEEAHGENPMVRDYNSLLNEYYRDQG